jgi:hypothetical protein
MKKIYFYFTALMAVLMGSVIQAQAPYHKMIGSNTSDWYIFLDFIPVKPAVPSSTISFNINSGKYSAYGDTIISTIGYKKMYEVYTNSPSFPSNYHLGFIREDTINRKIYFRDKNDTSDDLLYDFSLGLGGTIQLNYPYNSGSFTSGTYTVVVVDSVNTKVGFRKRQKLLTTGSDTLIHIESIGSIMHPLYLYGYFFQGGFFWGNPSDPCYYPYGIGLACKYSNDEKFFQSCTYTLAQSNPCIYKYDSCNYYTNCSSIKELSNVINYKLIPNPTADISNLEMDLINEEALSIELYDVSGRKLNLLYNGKQTSGKTSIPLHLSKYENGYYFIKVEGTKTNIFSPIIIAR